MPASPYPAGSRQECGRSVCQIHFWECNQKQSAEQYKPVFELGWQASTQVVNPYGKLDYVQPMSVKPGSTSYETTEVYCVGSFLLAGSELLGLAQ